MHQAARLFKLAVVGLAAACRTIQLVEGPGRIERAIADAFAANSNGILSVDDLVSVAYRGINRVEKKHRVGGHDPGGGQGGRPDRVGLSAGGDGWSSPSLLQPV